MVPQHVEELLKCYWSGSSGADIILINFFSWLSIRKEEYAVVQL